MKKHAYEDAAINGNDKTMDHFEFKVFANQFAHHFGLCDQGGDGGDGGDHGGDGGGDGGQCVPPDMSDNIFKDIDTNHNGKINKKELVVALKEFAKQEGHTITKEDWAWVKKHAVEDAAMNGDDKTMDP